MRLSLNNPALAAFLTVVGSGVIIGAVSFALNAVHLPSALDAVKPAGEVITTGPPGARQWLVASVYGLVAVVLTVALVVLLRSGVWLRGSVVTARAGFRTARVNLATAVDIRIDERIGRRDVVVPTLYAADPGGDSLSVPLTTGSGRTLPPHELSALADAIDAGARTGEDGRRASAVAADLTALAHRRPG